MHTRCLRLMYKFDPKIIRFKCTCKMNEVNWYSKKHIDRRVRAAYMDKKFLR